MSKTVHSIIIFPLSGEIIVTATVTDTGDRFGAEIVELYVKAPKTARLLKKTYNAKIRKVQKLRRCNKSDITV